MWPSGLQPARLLCPWGSPGKTTGVGCDALLQGTFPTQGLNQHFVTSPALADRFLPLAPPGKPLSHKGSPRQVHMYPKWKWVGLESLLLHLLRMDSPSGKKNLWISLEHYISFKEARRQKGFCFGTLSLTAFCQHHSSPYTHPLALFSHGWNDFEAVTRFALRPRKAHTAAPRGGLALGFHREHKTHL